MLSKILTLAGLQNLYQKGEATPVDVIQAVLDRIQASTDKAIWISLRTRLISCAVSHSITHPLREAPGLHSARPGAALFTSPASGRAARGLDTSPSLGSKSRPSRPSRPGR